MKATKASKASKKKNRIYLSVIAAFVVFGILMMFAVALVNCKDYFVSQLNTIGKDLNNENYEDSFANLDGMLSDLEGLAEAISSRKDVVDHNVEKSSIGDVVRAYAKKYPTARMRLLSPTKYDVMTVGDCGDFDMSRQPVISKLADDGKKGNTGLYYDSIFAAQTVIYYVPVTDTPDVIGIMMYITVEDMQQMIDFRTGELPPAYAVFMDENGAKITEQTAEGFSTDRFTSFYDTLDRLANSTSYSKELKNVLAEEGEYRLRMNFSGDRYILVARESEKVDGFYTAEIYLEDDIYEGGFSSYRQFYLIAITLCIVVFVLTIVVLFVNYEKAYDRAEDRDHNLGCDSYTKFQRVGQDILHSNRYSKYAVIYIDTGRLVFIRERFGTEATDDFLRSLAGIVEQSVRRNEAYGYVLDDQFVMLVKYEDKVDLIRRIKLINVIANSLPFIKTNHYSIKLGAGVYCITDPKNTPLQECIDRAVLAHKSHKDVPSEVCVFFDDSTRSANIKQADIEARMEYALKNGEFRLFLQPKYNIKTDKTDGAEVLIRWYNEATNSYQSPMDFIPIFEQNGFIVDLDHYVYEEACKFASRARSFFTSTIRISVNVSRVTAMSPDFLKFYITMKRKYGLANGVITIEFTESFAYENYDAMRASIIALKNEGINSSIDDFGSGYSSYNILKELPIDELKLDRFFIKKGEDNRRDKALLSMMIKFCNEMGITVTQEGVESTEEMVMLKNFGCDVVQGYVYSKPIMVSDFIDFMKKSTSFKEVTDIDLFAEE